MFQVARAGVGQLDAEQILRRHRRELSLGEGANVVRPAVGIFELMGSEADGKGPPPSLLFERVVQRLRRRAVGRARRLVEQQDVRLDHEGARHGDPLHFAVRQPVPLALEEPGDPEPRGDVLYQPVQLCASDPPCP